MSIYAWIIHTCMKTERRKKKNRTRTCVCHHMYLWCPTLYGWINVIFFELELCRISFIHINISFTFLVSFNKEKKREESRKFVESHNHRRLGSYLYQWHCWWNIIILQLARQLNRLFVNRVASEPSAFLCILCCFVAFHHTIYVLYTFIYTILMCFDKYYLFMDSHKIHMHTQIIWKRWKNWGKKFS